MVKTELLHADPKDATTYRKAGAEHSLNRTSMAVTSVESSGVAVATSKTELQAAVGAPASRAETHVMSPAAQDVPVPADTSTLEKEFARYERCSWVDPRPMVSRVGTCWSVTCCLSTTCTASIH